MMKRGAIDYLVKDVEFLQLVPEVVRRALVQLERDRKLAAAEEALRRSESNLAKAQEIAHLGSYELHVLPSGQNYYSEEIYRILGVDPASPPTTGPDPIAARVHPDDLVSYRETLHRAMREGAPFRLEYRVIRPDASIRYVQSVAEPIVGKDGNAIRLVGTLLDITERKRAELHQQVQFATTRGLAESATLTDAAPVVLRAICQTLDWDHGEFWRVDGRTGALRCIETWARTRSRADAHDFGPELPRHVQQLVAPFWSSDLRREQRFKGVTRGRVHAAAGVPVLQGADMLGVVALYSFEVRPADPGLLRLFMALGAQLGQFLERTRAEEALRKEHAFTSAILDTSAALVVVLDRAGRIVRFNRACERTTGFAAAEVLGRFAWDLFVPPEEVTAARAGFAGAVDQYPSRNESYWVTRQGGKRLVAWSNSSLADEEGAVEYVISIGIDITERRRLEQEILQISDMEQRRIGQDLHDGLCQHLAATELMGEILEQKVARKSKEDARRVAEITRQVREAISQTRLLARGLSPVVLESQGLMSALEELCDYTQRMFRTACDFRCPTPVLIEDHTAATHLYRIAQEAVSNAIRHGKARHITIVLEQPADRITLRIQDDGSGLPEDLGKAKGMGLRIMQYRAAMIGGFLTIERAAGGGTRVSCSRPARPQERAV
jgi:PAS domain S-box-containing protein